ncbi:MAG: phosphonopyruvate decarboxylase [Salinivirgaceae bacterium]|nr:phosphonopyruvate decarboxylase [Salinivirgaceae bacterium]MDD4746352.1 phosphonopyruvate decarboxylase [Salinivirgaceae bacterium]MDY0280126.1 phosphonopyruvate decarboxylase [Salinivirgaceae bacterium]
MISPAVFYKWLTNSGISFFSGVPDSLLKDICAYITDHTSKRKHIIAANEGGAVALASGHYMASGEIPVVYMQNSGIGNAVNPLLSLVDKQVYNIPMLLLIGWRGEPGNKDEPQHVTQGEVTLDLLKALRIPHLVLEKEEDVASKQVQTVFAQIRKTNLPFAIIIRKGTFEKYSIVEKIKSNYTLSREEAITQIVRQSNDNEVFVSTTGKTSRELFECRVHFQQPHHFDFLTVGSMGHSSQIALGVALSKPNKRVICIDGDGAVLMHMGSLSIIGDLSPNNFVHIVINNGAHESVGGQPTVGFNVDFPGLAKANKYKYAISVSTAKELKAALEHISADTCPVMIEIKVKTGSRDNLGRPTIKPVDNKADFMNNLKQ